MSTPWTGIITISVTDQPQKITQGGRNQLLLLNLDENNEIWVGYNSAAAGIASSVSIPPLGNITMTDLLPMYAVCDSGNSASLSIVPGGTAFAPSAVQIATQLLPLAVDIAEQIAAIGIPLVASPTLLYNVPSGALAGAGPVGATSLLSGYPAYSDRLALAQYIDTVLTGSPALTCQKWFLQNWITNSTVGSNTHNIPVGLDELITNGCQIILCVSPVQSSNYGGLGDPSVADYGTASPPTGLLGTLTVLQSKYGAAVSNMLCVLQQEPNGQANPGPGFKFPSAAAYGLYVNYYAGALTTAGVPNWCDLATNHGTGGNYQAFFQAPTAHFAGLLCDYYGNTWAGENNNPSYLLDQPFGSSTLSLMDLADTYPSGAIPFGLGEWGMCQQGVNQPLPQTGTGSWEAFCNYIIGVFATRLNDGKINAPVCWFSGANNPEYNVLPVFTEGSAGSQYNLTAGINSVWEAISSSATTLTVAAGATVTVPPLEGQASPNAGYAVLNGLSYEIIIGSQAAAGSTNPFDTVRLIYFDQDDPDALPFEQTRWNIPATASTAGGPTSISGRGPEHGQFGLVQITNHDTVAHTVQLQILSTSRAADIHDWRWDAQGSGAIPGYTLPPTGGHYNNCLGAWNAEPVPAASGGNPGQLIYLLSLFAGQAYVRFGTGATNATSVISVQLVPLPETGSFGGSLLLNEPLLDTNDYTAELILPRAPCMVVFSNTDTISHTVNGTVTNLG